MLQLVNHCNIALNKEILLLLHTLGDFQVSTPKLVYTLAIYQMLILKYLQVFQQTIMFKAVLQWLANCSIKDNLC